MSREPIYSDDPQAIQKLEDKLARLQTQQKRMVALNAAWRKAKKPAPDDVVGWGKIADTLGQDLWQLDRIRVNMARDCLDRAPYTYEISNNNGNMKRIKDRIVGLMEAEAKEAHDKLTPQGKVAAEGLVDAFFQSEEIVHPIRVVRDAQREPPTDEA
jgi:hypothetical protein